MNEAMVATAETEEGIHAPTHEAVFKEADDLLVALKNKLDETNPKELADQLRKLVADTRQLLREGVWAKKYNRRLKKNYKR